jgi:hypothetical protein
MYTAEAIELRRCKALRADGSPCKGWARWADPGQLCNIHAGRHHRGPMRGSVIEQQSHACPPCTCVAYAWPHRPGGGLCCWPNAPTYRSTIPAGRHNEFYSRTRDRRW